MTKPNTLNSVHGVWLNAEQIYLYAQVLILCPVSTDAHSMQTNEPKKS